MRLRDPKHGLQKRPMGGKRCVQRITGERDQGLTRFAFEGKEELRVSAIARFLGRTSGALALACALVCACSSPTHHFTSTSPLVTLTQISRDPYTNKISQHQTEVEPDTFAFGNTVVAAFKAGRFFKGGASNIGWATSITGGRSWTHGFLPGTSVFACGSYEHDSDRSFSYDEA